MKLLQRFRGDLRRILSAIERADALESRLSPQLLELVLVLEDKRFFRHKGVDLIAAMRAAASLLVGRPRGGASTIDMQLARTISGYRTKTILRKLYESGLAIAVRRSAAPESILNAYLAIAYLGTRITGVEAAATRLFGRPTSNLSAEESAELAALLVYPLPEESSASWERKVKRRARYGIARRIEVRVPFQER